MYSSRATANTKSSFKPPFPGEVDVVYAKVNNCDELQKLADGIVTKFAETGTDNFQKFY